MKTIKILIIALIFFAAGFFLGQSYHLPSLSPASKPAVKADENLQITYRLQFSDSELIEFQNVKIQKNETVLEVLQRLALENDIALATKDYQDLGTMVTKIGEKENGQSNQYWQYLVNGEYAQVGTNQYLLKGNETVEWIFSGDYFNQ